MDHEPEPPFYAGEVRKEVAYIVECFNCLEEQIVRGGTRRLAERWARASGWKDVDPDGWACSECLPKLRKGGAHGR